MLLSEIKRVSYSTTVQMFSDAFDVLKYSFDRHELRPLLKSHGLTPQTEIV